MRRLLRHWRRLLLAVFLLGLGYVLYQRLPPVERWSVRLEEDATATFSFSSDGRFIFSHRLDLGPDWLCGPFRKRDGATGELLAEASSKQRIYQSAHKRFWAGLPQNEPGILELFDLDSGKERRLPIKSFSGERRLVLSPAEDMVAIFCFKDKEGNPEAEVFLHGLPGGEQVGILSTTGAALFSPDGSYFVYPSTTPEDPCLRLWDTRKRQSGGILPGAHKIYDISPNGHFLLAEPVNKENGKTELWDLSDPAKPREVAALPASARRLEITPDSRTLVELPTEKNRDVVFWDSATGQEKGRTPAPFIPYTSVFSPDSRLLALRECPDPGNFPVAVIDLHSRQVLWSKQLGDHAWEPGELLFALIPGHVDSLFLGVFDPDEGFQHPQFRNARSGELLATFAMPFRKLRSSHSDKGQRILICGHGKSPRNQKQGWFWETLRHWLPSDPDRVSDLIRVIDVPTLREVFHLADSHVEEAELSPDGGTLLTVHPKNPAGPHLRCWDIPGRHPWLKIVGIPAAAGLVLLLLGKWRQARKERKASFQATTVSGGATLPII